MTPRPPADQAARDRIATDLASNLLVEAGAGSGKTTSLVQRMVNLVRAGEPVERIAAVTFTRKAANELREKFQLGLEAALRGDQDAATRDRFRLALDQLGGSFLGTIHSFCGRLLRERAFEAGLDPTFEELEEEQFTLLQDDFFNRHLERARLAGDPGLLEVTTLGIDPRDLGGAFARLVENADIRFPLTQTPRPDHTPCRQQLEALLGEADELMPKQEPAAGWDKLMTTVRRLRYFQRVNDFSELSTFCDLIETITSSGCKPTQNRWSDDKEGKQAAKNLGQAFQDLLENAVQPLLTAWRAHRYPPVIRFLQAAVAAFALERRQQGRLGFQDLLSGAAELLRGSGTARKELGDRYRRLLVDEFQDTDPIQAEVCLLLTSEPDQGNDWRAVAPRAGALFVVGDPKQSIYRFRRADLETYTFVRGRMQAFGAVLELTRNFRSTQPIERLVNAFAQTVFPQQATAHQAPFAFMQTENPATPADGVFHYLVPTARGKGQALSDDAARLATWIAAQVESRQRGAGDFLVLVRQSYWVEAYARALGERNIPVVTTGARLPQERELRELRLLLEALADPANPVLIAAVLEGLFFGLDHPQLFQARQAGTEFTAAREPQGQGPVIEALARLHRWHADAYALPADLLLERLLDETGLLPYAASQPLGDGRAGTLLRLLETLRVSASESLSGLSGAIELIDAALDAEASATLRPGAGDVVRVMNLHRAKGLEASVVVLAAPLAPPEHAPDFHVRRTEDGASGWLEVRTEKRPIAHPPGWAGLQAEEARFLEAEENRLLYVAATRAKHQLLVARMIKDQPKEGEPAEVSAWAPLSTALEQHGSVLTLEAVPAPGRRELQRPFEAVAGDAQAADARLRQAAQPTFEVRPPVTRDLKTDRHERLAYDLVDARRLKGRDWGTAVHRAIEAMGRGREGDSLRRFLRAVARDHNLGRDAAELDDSVNQLEQLLARERSLPEWQSRLAHELPVLRVDQRDGLEQISEGVVDLLLKTGDRYQVLDWKTDRAGDAVWEARAPQYEAQVARYTEMLRALGFELEEGRLEHLT